MVHYCEGKPYKLATYGRGYLCCKQVGIKTIDQNGYYNAPTRCSNILTLICQLC